MNLEKTEAVETAQKVAEAGGVDAAQHFRRARKR